MKMLFGKHAGKSLENIPGDYLCWLLSLPDLDAYLRGEIKRVLETRGDRAYKKQKGGAKP